MDRTDFDRRRALDEYAILDTAHEEAFDRIARMTARLLGVPIVKVGILDRDRIWYKATCGTELKEHSAEFSFCAETVRHGEFFAINNPQEHEQYAGHPLLDRDEPVRFYAGVPLIVKGPLGMHGPVAVGALGIMDTKPRELQPSEIETLQDLAAITVDELDLHAARQRTGQVLESISDAFFALDHQWRFTYINPQAEELLQRSRSELIGRNVWEEFPEARGSTFQRQYEKAIREGVTVQFEAFYNPLDTWFSVRAFPYRDGLTVYFLDITERRQMEENLRKREHRFRLLFRDNPLPMWVYDRETLRFLAVNDATVDHYGYSEDEFLGMRITDIHPESEVARLMENLSGDRSELERSGPWKHQLRDGRIIEVDITSHTIAFDDEEAVLVVAQDVTERLEAERALRKRERYLSVTLDSIGDAVITTDADGCVARMNPIAERLTGWSQEEARGRSLADVFQIQNAQTGKPVENPVDVVLREGKTVGLANHTELIARDGTKCQIADSAAPIRIEDGTLLGVVLVFRDVTEQYKQQQALYESKLALEEAQKITQTGNIILDVTSDTIELSEEAGRILGLDPDQPHDIEAFWALVYPDDEPIVREASTQVRQHQEPYDIEFRITPRGRTETRWVRGRGQPMGNEAGTTTKVLGTISDITERKEHESTVQRFGRLLDASVNEIFLFEEDTLRFVQVNRGARQNLGYSMEELRRMTPLDLKPYSPDEFASILEPLRTGEQDIVTFETTHRRKDGSLYPVEVHLQLSRQETPPLFIAVILDITERKETETALRRSEERFRAVSEQAVDVIAIIDEEAHYLYLSPSFEAVTGFTRAELMGENGMKRVHPDDQPRAQEALTQALADPDYTIDMDIRYQHRDGDWRYLSVAGRRLTTPSDDTEVLLNVRDVTEQRRATERIAALHEIGRSILTARSAQEIAKAALKRLARIIPNTRSSVVELNSASNEAFMLAVDTEYETDIPAGRHLPMDALTIPDELKAGTVRRVDHLTPETAHQDIEEQLRKEGIRSYFNVPLAVEDTIIGILSVGADAPAAFESNHFDVAQEVADMLALALQQARTQEELRAAKEEAEEMNRLKSAFLANMSHEIRTPLTSIIGFAEILSLQDLDEEASRFTRLIRKGGERLLETLNSVLDLSQLESGSIQLSPMTIDVTREVRDAANLFVHRATEQEVNLTLNAPDAPLQARLDSAALRRILNNLLSNAMKFTEPGDAITIQVKPREETFILRVKDTGVGIESEFIPHLFDAFKQESTGSARAFEGSGLGLTITHQLVELMGGSIEVDSTKGEGSCFTVTLPREMKQREVQSSDAGSARSR